MYSYEVWVRSVSYHSKKPLTYTSVQRLERGTVVKVDLRNSLVLGIVYRETSAPKGVAMKPISQALLDGTVRIPAEGLQLLRWMIDYYPAGSGSITQLFLPASWPSKNPDIDPGQSLVEPIKLPPLTTEQKNVLSHVRKRPGSFMLHGDTGSGKTRVYIELVKRALEEGRSSLILVPEIGLTPHMLARFSQQFDPNIIKVFHSGLSPATRKSTWLAIARAKTPIVVIGPRSALFAPLSNIGFIAVDEAHDDGYKQENSPYYHGVRVAARLANIHNATLILGSATPAINDMFIAERKDIPILRMDKTAIKSPSKLKTTLVNRKDKTEFSHSRYISNSLINQITQQLRLGQQTLLFLNRRGSARVIACTQCGWRAQCPRCNLPLTLHEDTFSLRCHTCGYHTTAPTQCPDCANTDIVYLGPGTKALEKELTKLFPDSRIARFDGDNLTHERLEKHFESIENGSIDIIIGTQILIKGFDIPKLGLVGIVDADSSLSFPDFTAEERMYQLISQAIGRVGRGHIPGEVVVQTLYPDSPLLTQALQKNWKGFYAAQLAERRTHEFPPFTFLLKLECARKRPGAAEQASKKLKVELTKEYPNITVLGPTPAFVEKQRGYYVWQLIIKSHLRSNLVDIINKLPSGWKYDIDPTHLL